MKRKKKKQNFLYVLTLALLMFVITSVLNFIESSEKDAEKIRMPKESGLYVHFIDVGQADSILVNFPNGENMLIDAGNNSDGGKVSAYIKKCGTEKIDYLVGTHPHADHIGGLDDVLRNFETGKIYMPKATANTATYEDVLIEIKKKGLRITEAREGVMISAGDVRCEILSPCHNFYEELNDYSAVIRLTYGETSFLFTGDAEEGVERELSRRYNLKSNVLKVSHHGSNTSSCTEFINNVKPEFAVISVGEGNDYGHPSERVIKRLQRAGCEIFRTDTDGDIIMRSDGKNVYYEGVR